jgi:hypothetical protein
MTKPFEAHPVQSRKEIRTRLIKRVEQVVLPNRYVCVFGCTRSLRAHGGERVLR